MVWEIDNSFFFLSSFLNLCFSFNAQRKCDTHALQRMHHANTSLVFLLPFLFSVLVNILLFVVVFILTFFFFFRQKSSSTSFILGFVTRMNGKRKMDGGERQLLDGSQWGTMTLWDYQQLISHTYWRSEPTSIVKGKRVAVQKNRRVQK